MPKIIVTLKDGAVYVFPVKDTTYARQRTGVTFHDGFATIHDGGSNDSTSFPAVNIQEVVERS